MKPCRNAWETRGYTVTKGISVLLGIFMHNVWSSPLSENKDHMDHPPKPLPSWNRAQSSVPALLGLLPGTRQGARPVETSSPRELHGRGADIPALPVRSEFQRLCLGVGKNKEGLSIHMQKPTLCCPNCQTVTWDQSTCPCLPLPTLVSGTCPVSPPSCQSNNLHAF